MATVDTALATGWYTAQTKLDLLTRLTLSVLKLIGNSKFTYNKGFPSTLNIDEIDHFVSFNKQ